MPSLWRPSTFQGETAEPLCQNILQNISTCTFHCKASYPLCPMRMTRRSSPYLFLIHLMPCSWGSTMRGQRWQEVRMVAFSLDILSAGSPSFCQAAMSASSASMVRGSRSGVTGMGTLQMVLMSVYLNYVWSCLLLWNWIYTWPAVMVVIMQMVLMHCLLFTHW